MPLPSPKNGEKRSDFVNRCVSDLSNKGEFDDGKQRAAVCYDIYKEAKSEASLVVSINEDEILYFSSAADKNKPLNKPFRTPKGPKKFSVYVKNDKGNVVKVNFGDPNMEIKRDDPKRRKAFRSRHNCDNAGPKWKARYWSCKMWSKKSVTNMTKGSEEYEWDGETVFDKEEIEESLARVGLWENIRRKKAREGKNYKPAKKGDPDRPDEKSWKKAQQPKKKSESYHKNKKKSYGSPDVSKHYFKTEEEAKKDAQKMGLKGIHTHKTEDGKTLYMAGPNHEAFMKRHEEIAGKTKKEWDKIDKKELKRDTKKEKVQHEKDAIEDDKSKIKKLKKGVPSEKKKAEERALKKDIKYDKKSKKSYAAERYGGKKRGDLKDSDFLDPKRRSFPVVSCQDVKDAVSSWGRYKGSMTFEQFKAKLTRRAKKLGCESSLPKAWKD